MLKGKYRFELSIMGSRFITLRRFALYEPAVGREKSMEVAHLFKYDPIQESLRDGESSNGRERWVGNSCSGISTKCPI